jgi:phosphatidate cytidylyltransferase
MAMNWGVFRTRALTALVFVVVMSAGLLTSHWMFLLLFTVIHFGCWYEFQRLMGVIYSEYTEISPFHRYGVQLAGWGGILLATANVWSVGTVTLSSIGFWILLLFLLIFPVAEVLFTRQPGFKTIRLSLIGLIYISVSIALIVHIRSGAIWLNESADDLASLLSSVSAKIGGFFIPLLMIASIWINDTMAYIVGSFIGKTPLSAVSPKKTWEGTIGGVVLSTAIVTAFGYFYGASWWDFLAISLIAAIAGTLGDLFESKLKRMAGVKDSGHFMPGHGGFLDRFDSLLFAIPFVWLYTFFFTR